MRYSDVAVNWRSVVQAVSRVAEVDMNWQKKVIPRTRLLLFMSGLWFILSVHSQAESGFEFKFIDDYLKQWDEFAQGANDLAPKLKKDAERFDAELAKALLAKDPRAPSRVLFYAVVQVGGFIPADGEIGRPLTEIVTGTVPVFTDKNGQKRYFAGDLFCWWEAGGHEFPRFWLYEEWKKRDFAQKTVIPWYLAACNKKK